MPLHPHELCCCAHTFEEHTEEGCQFDRQYGPEERRGKNCPCKNFIWAAAAPDLLEALKDLHRECVGLAAYLETCAPDVILENLSTMVHSLKHGSLLAEAAIRKAKGN
jgi:hypothetical protein